MATTRQATEAHQMLSEIYNWFTEGFDTKDLQEGQGVAARIIVGDYHANVQTHGSNLERERELCIQMPGNGCGKLWRVSEEALENLKEAVELYLENAKLLGMLKELQEALTTPGKFTTSFEAAVR